MHFFLLFVWFFSIGYATIPLFWLAVHPFADYWRDRKGKIYPLLGLIWLIIIAIVMFATWPWVELRLYSTSWAWLPAAILLAIGLALYRALTRGNRMARETIMGRPELRPEENAQLLVTTGLHGVIRHPIYMAHLLMLTACAVGTGMTVIYALWILAIITGAIMIRTEEKELEIRFGDAYREYRSRVPAIIPRF